MSDADLLATPAPPSDSGSPAETSDAPQTSPEALASHERSIAGHRGLAAWHAKPKTTKRRALAHNRRLQKEKDRGRNGRESRRQGRAQRSAANERIRSRAAQQRRERLDVAYGMGPIDGVAGYVLTMRFLEEQKQPDESWKLFDPASPIPLYEQIAQRFRLAIATGELRRGERLPAHFALQDLLGISRGTVSKAYIQLSREGLVRMSRNKHKGVFVIDVPNRQSTARRQAAAQKVMLDALLKCRRLGLTADEMKSMVNCLVADPIPPAPAPPMPDPSRAVMQSAF